MPLRWQCRGTMLERHTRTTPAHGTSLMSAMDAVGQSGTMRPWPSAMRVESRSRRLRLEELKNISPCGLDPSLRIVGHSQPALGQQDSTAVTPHYVR